MKCRHCREELDLDFLDLGFAPPSNAYLNEADLVRPEKYYPLKIMVCDRCWLVQTEDYAQAEELFSPDYAYFSSTSSSWLAHAKAYVVAISKRLGLGKQSFVVEVAANDGYLLRNFLAAGVPCLGIEPTDSTATAAEQLGIPVIREFFGEALGVRLAASARSADLIIGNNVYAHVPDINDFTRGLRAALKPAGVVTLEFPHLLRLLEHAQFDTVYHEHFSYHALHTVSVIFRAAGLRLWDVEELATHGGSLRVYGCRSDGPYQETPAVAAVLATEARAGLQCGATYGGFQARADRVKNDFLEFLVQARKQGRSVAAYGAAAKGNTLMNYAGVKPDLLPFVCDAATSKQGKYMPGSHVPIVAPAMLDERRPDFLVILPWNIADEVKAKYAHLARQGTKFVTAVPQLIVS